MRVLFDIVHPAQVHFFKNTILKLQERGDQVLVTSRRKDVTLELLDALAIKHVTISRKGSSFLGMALELVFRTAKMAKIVSSFKPDVMVARVGHSIGFVGKLFGVPTVIYDDMEPARLQSLIGMSFATYICTGLGYYRDFGKRQVRFQGLPVLAYLSPKYFTPNPVPLIEAGIDLHRPYVFLRIVSWMANHDIGRKCNDDNQILQVVEQLSHYGRVIISSELPLGDGLSRYTNPVPVEFMHDLLAHAALCLVEGGTMAAEGAALGVPVICLESYEFGYLNALENDYKLIFRTKSMSEALQLARGILSRSDTVDDGQYCKMLDESEDVGKFMLDILDVAVSDFPLCR